MILNFLVLLLPLVLGLLTRERSAPGGTGGGAPPPPLLSKLDLDVRDPLTLCEYTISDQHQRARL